MTDDPLDPRACQAVHPQWTHAEWIDIIDAGDCARVTALLREVKAKAEQEHCKDCCCARSWRALGIDSYTGKDIPAHIRELLAERDRLCEIVREACDRINDLVNHLERAKAFCGDLRRRAGLDTEDR